MSKKRRKPDYSFKSFVMTNYDNLLKDMRKASYIDFANANYIQNGVLSPYFEPTGNYSYCYSDILQECVNNGLRDVFLECERINKATYNRTTRLKNRILSMLLEGQCLFVTLTFNDSCMSCSSEEDRRRYVQRYLKSLGCRYVANIDYGGKNGREHYHAVVRIDNIKLGKDNYWTKNYGNLNVEKVRFKNASPSKSLAKYISKLTNHAIKETTKRACYIYSR